MNCKFEVATSLAVASTFTFHALVVEIALLDPSGPIVRVRPEHAEERPISGYQSTLRNFAPTVAATGTATPWSNKSYVGHVAITIPENLP